MNYLLDTDVLIDYSKGKAQEKIINLIESDSPLYITSVNTYEFLKGITQTFPAEVYLSRFIVIDFTEAIAKKAALIYILLKKKGQLIRENDIFISACAIHQNATLITRNKKDFVKIQKVIPELKIF